jgi:hypothetical protein
VVLGLACAWHLLLAAPGAVPWQEGCGVAFLLVNVLKTRFDTWATLGATAALLHACQLCVSAMPIHCVAAAQSCLTCSTSLTLLLSVSCCLFHLLCICQALAEKEGEGMAKMLYRKDTGEILGVHIIGLHAADLIHEASNAIATKQTVQVR